MSGNETDMDIPDRLTLVLRALLPRCTADDFAFQSEALLRLSEEAMLDEARASCALDGETQVCEPWEKKKPDGGTAL